MFINLVNSVIRYVDFYYLCLFVGKEVFVGCVIRGVYYRVMSGGVMNCLFNEVN